MDTKTIEELKAKLLAEKKRFEDKLASFAKKTGQPGDYNTQWEDYGDDEEENAAEVAAYTDSLGLEQTFESELADVITALSLIQDGTYGICAVCGKSIDPQRLSVRPQSLLCMACMEKK